MSIKKLFVSCLLLLLQFNANSQILKWIEQFGPATVTTGNVPKTIAVDQEGNSYISGSFTGYNPIDINPSNNPADTFFVFNTELGISGGYLMKLDPEGNFVWGLPLDSSNQGGVSSAFDIDGNLILIAQGNKTKFYKINPLTGTIRDYGILDVSIDPYGPSKIAVSKENNLFISGFYIGNADMDPGPSQHILNGSLSAGSMFVLKLDSDFNFKWAKNFIGYGDQHSAVRDIAVDEEENVFTSGYIQDTVDFDPGIDEYKLITGAVSDIFISKLDRNGNFVWAKKFTSNTPLNGYHSGNAIAIDHGDVLVGGVFGQNNEVIDFNPGEELANLQAYGYNAFLLRLTNSGDFIWVKQISNYNVFETCTSLINAIKIDLQGNIFCGGNFNKTQGIISGNDTIYLNSGDNRFDAFIMKLATNGDYKWVKKIGKSVGSEIKCTGIGLDNSGSIYGIGGLEGTTDINPELQIPNLTANGFGIGPIVFKMSDTFSKELGDSLQHF